MKDLLPKPSIFLIFLFPIGLSFLGLGSLPGVAQQAPAMEVIETTLQQGHAVSSKVPVSPMAKADSVSGPSVVVVRHGFPDHTAGTPNQDLTSTFRGSIRGLPGTYYRLLKQPKQSTGILRESPVAPIQAGQGASLLIVTAPDPHGNIVTAPGALAVGYGLNAPIDVSVQSSGGNPPTGTVSLLDAGVQIAQLPLDNTGHAEFVNCDPYTAPFCLNKGIHTLTVAYSGDTNFAPNTSAALAYTIDTGSPFALVGFFFRVDNTVEILADFDTGVNLLGTAPTGSLIYQDTVNGTTTALGPPAPLTQAQPIAFRDFNLGPGDHTITLQYSGDSTYLGSSTSPVPFHAPALPGQPVQVSFTAPTAPLAVGDATTFTVNVVASQSSGVPTGNVDVAAGPSFVSHRINALANGSATVPGVVPNTYSWQAPYLGDSTFASAWSTPTTLLISRATVPLFVSSDSPSVAAGTPVTLSGRFGVLFETDEPEGVIQFFDSFNGGTAVPLGFGQPILFNNPAVSISTLLPAGVHNITASYSGDTSYTPFTSSLVTVTVTGGPAPAFTLTAPNGGDTATITLGQTASYNVLLNGNGFLGVVSFSCTGAPAGSSCSANPNPAQLTNTATSVQLVVSVAPSQSSSVRLYQSPFAIAGVFGLAILGFHRKGRTRRAFLCLTALCLMVALTACGGGSGMTSSSLKQTGTFTLTLTASSGSTTSSIPLTLTVK